MEKSKNVTINLKTKKTFYVCDSDRCVLHAQLVPGRNRNSVRRDQTPRDGEHGGRAAAASTPAEVEQHTGQLLGGGRSSRRLLYRDHQVRRSRGAPSSTARSEGDQTSGFCATN